MDWLKKFKHTNPHVEPQPTETASGPSSTTGGYATTAGDPAGQVSTPASTANTPAETAGGPASPAGGQITARPQGTSTTQMQQPPITTGTAEIAAGSMKAYPEPQQVRAEGPMLTPQAQAQSTPPTITPPEPPHPTTTQAATATSQMPAQSVTETTATLPIQEEALQPQKQPAEPILPATKTGSIGNPVQRLIQKAKNTFRPPEDTALLEAEKFSRGLVNLQDLLAPSAIEVDFNHIQIGDTYYRTYFIISYPREVGANWLAPLINFAAALDISMFYYPVQAKTVLSNLRRKITELQAELNIEQKGGRILDPDIQLALNDAKKLQEEITAERQRFFQFGLYITVPAKDKKELIATCHQLESILGSIMVAPRSATLQMEDAIKLTIPYFNDTLKVSRNMDTTSIATTLPFTSSSLSSDQGIMYGINEHNGSLIIFDRFQMENANSVIFGTSGSGKSYMIKLEAVRSLMLGTDIIIIDPENEYKTLCDAIGGAFIDLNFSSESRINPFDISRGYSTGENELNVKILTLHSLFKTMLGEMNAAQEAMLDRALIMTYRLKGITQNPETHSLEPPLLEDLYKVFLGMEEEEGKNLADRLEKFVLGSAKGLFNRQTNMDLDNTFIVYGVRDLPDSVRPIGMFLILDFIWTRIRHDRKKRILLVDEAWLLMKYPDSAQFLYSVAKRGRKYYLGLTTITQNIDEFLAREEGKAIINNASIRILMKQSSSAIDQLAKTFYLSEGEKNLLLSANVGEGIFFAGKSHVAMQVVASNDEHRLITTNPAELRLLEQQEKSEDATDG